MDTNKRPKNYWVKICGLTEKEDIEKVAKAGANAIGLMFAEQSKRFIDPLKAAELSSHARSFGLEVVGVFLNHTREQIVEIQKKVHMDLIQLHGDEDAPFAMDLMKALKLPVMKAISMSDSSYLKAYKDYGFLAALLLDNKVGDSYGGTGKSFEWDLLNENIPASPYTIIAGGLNPQNIEGLFQYENIYGFDLSSGVESAPGKKDLEKIEAFMKKVKSAQQKK